jgi:hypothetical protein
LFDANTFANLDVRSFIVAPIVQFNSTQDTRLAMLDANYGMRFATFNIASVTAKPFTPSISSAPLIQYLISSNLLAAYNSKLILMKN